jgi:hypothetical protein
MWKKIIIACALVFITPVVNADENHEDRANARAAAQMWLETVDHKHYSESWKDTSTYFKGRMDRAAWEKQLTSLRQTAGRLKSRVLTSEEIQVGVPEDHKLEYYLLKFSSSYEHKETATETVTMMQDKDGYWRLAGYFLK